MFSCIRIVVVSLFVFISPQCKRTGVQGSSDEYLQPTRPREWYVELVTSMTVLGEIHTKVQSDKKTMVESTDTDKKRLFTWLEGMTMMSTYIWLQEIPIHASEDVFV